MSPTDRPRPTPGELQILRALWRSGPATVRDLLAELGDDAGSTPGYTTVLKLLQIMTAKGLVERDESRRSHVYRPVAAEDETQRQLIGDLVDRAFDGSATRLVVQALSAHDASAEELAEIRRLLDEKEARP